MSITKGVYNLYFSILNKYWNIIKDSILFISIDTIICKSSIERMENSH